MTAPRSWHGKAFDFDFQSATLDELLEVWAANRNNNAGVTAAHEVCKRLHQDRINNSNSEA